MALTSWETWGRREDEGGGMEDLGRGAVVMKSVSVPLMWWAVLVL